MIGAVRVLFFVSLHITLFFSLSLSSWLACLTVRMYLFFTIVLCFSIPPWMHKHYVECISTFTFTLLRPQRHKYWMNDNQYIRIIKLFALSQTGFSMIWSRIPLHTHTHTQPRENLVCVQRRSVNSHMTRECESITNECVAHNVSLVIDIYLMYRKRTNSTQSLSTWSRYTCCLCRYSTCERRTNILVFATFTCDVSAILDFVAMWRINIYTVKFVWVSPINSESTNPTIMQMQRQHVSLGKIKIVFVGFINEKT